MAKNNITSRRGLTLVEWLIVILTIGALLVIAVPRIGQSATTAKINTCKTNIDVINRQIELYKVNTGAYPATLLDVTGNTDYFRDGPPECPFGTSYTMGANNRVAKHSH